MLYLSFQGHSFKFELPILLSIYIMGQCWWEVRLERSAANILYCWYCYIVNQIDLPSLLFPVQWCWWQARLLKLMQTKSLPKLTAGLCPPHFSKWCVIFSICWYVCHNNPRKWPLMEQGYWLPFIDKCCIINLSTLLIVALFVQICSVCLYLIQSSIFLLLLLLLLLLLNVNTWKKQKLWKSESQMGFEPMTLGDLLSQRVVGSNPIKDWDFSEFVFLHVFTLNIMLFLWYAIVIVVIVVALLHYHNNNKYCIYRGRSTLLPIFVLRLSLSWWFCWQHNVWIFIFVEGGGGLLQL